MVAKPDLAYRWIDLKMFSVSSDGFKVHIGLGGFAKYKTIKYTTIKYTIINEKK